MSYSFSQNTSEQIKSHGLALAEVERQIKLFEDGIPFVHLSRPATVGDGIRRLTEEQQKNYVEQFRNTLNHEAVRVMKFVPASGAASRMFRDLETILNTYDKIDDAVLAKDDKTCAFAREFVHNIRKFAFWDALKDVLQKDGMDAEKLIANQQYRPLIEYTLRPAGLNYASMPKALILFHRDEDGVPVTSLAEHFGEAVNYLRDKHGNAALHFTISPEFTEQIEQRIEENRKLYKGEVSFDVSLSNQLPSTDTIAVDEENKPFLDENGDILFRPGGHGALLTNLNNLEADIVFIKNIDNVSSSAENMASVLWKEVLGGLLAQTRKSVFDWKERLRNTESEKECDQAIAFCRDELNLSVPEELETAGLNEKKKQLLSLLDRPIRVCGMVKNEGEPGGGPFWIEKEGMVNKLQIVESDQMDESDEQQMNIVEQSTHFNPVDIVCSLTNEQGESYDLNEFLDPETAFIASKSYDGRNLKALERPGLWNGAMAEWISIFVEVPISTFNPVKTVNDLLREEHQA